jgi:hypothetical protein
MTIRRLATRSLRPGDLTALSQVARGSVVDESNRLDRLRRRGFVAHRRGGRPKVTVPGLLALAVKRFGMR